MTTGTLCRDLLAAISCSFFATIIIGSMGQAAETYRLDNGMTVILKEQHSSPMISSVVFVRSGSKYESRYENGITHFLEHLLFDGTATLSREEIDASIRDRGGYINAFTRKELTAYLVLLPKQYIEYGMTVQADMLFNSVFPESELAKERKVVVEEILKDADAPGAPAEQYFTSLAYAGTDYARPVLGYQAFIENIPREAVIDYWRRYYIPRNMVLLVIGDFEPQEMKRQVERVFGRVTAPDVPIDLVGGTAAPGSVIDAKHIEVSPSGQARHDTVGNVISTYVNFSIAAPHYSDSDYYAMDVLAQYLGMEGVSPLMVALKGGAEPLATEVSVSLVPYEEFSRLEIAAVTERAENRDTIVATILGQLRATGTTAPNQESIEGIKTTVRTGDIYNEAKLHYYGFMIAPYLMTAGWEFVQSYAEQIGEVEWGGCAATARRWLAEPQYVATVVRPAEGGGQELYTASVMMAEEVQRHFDATAFAAYTAADAKKVVYPPAESISFVLEDRADYRREELPNGMTVIVKSAPGNEVFAMMVLGRNRSANEPEGQAGITDFVNRCLDKGTVVRTAGELADDLAGIGAQVTLYDNPWIPYDDRYTSRSFSFMKFETIEEFARQGFDLFCEMAFSPAFDSIQVEGVRQGMIGVLRRQGTSPREVARDLYYRELFGESGFAQPVMGTPAAIGSITVADLRAHHARFYSPENTILVLVTGRPADEVMAWVKEGPGQRARAGYEAKAPWAPEPLRQIRAIQSPLEKEQVAIYLGGLIPGAGHADAWAIEVAAGILSNRLYLNLREEQGLAYSVGAGSDADRGFGWYYVSMGTGADNYRRAVGGILLEMEKLALDGPSTSEVNRARNEMWGRLMSAKLSAINQGFYLAVDEFLGRPTPSDLALLNALVGIDREAVRRVAAQYFRTDGYVLATAGRTPAEVDGEGDPSGE